MATPKKTPPTAAKAMPPAAVDARMNPAGVAPADARVGQGQARMPTPPVPGGIKVRATKVCYYDDKRRRVDDVFTIKAESEFSSNYMERVDPRTPERITTGKEVLQQQHDEILAGKRVEANPDLAPPKPGVIDDDE
jgi:hypothetical protein